jgi:RNA polymerase sigma-32 factor
MSENDSLDPSSLATEGTSLLPEGTRLASGSEALEVFDPLKKYLTEIRKFPLLSREEELELAKRWWHEKDRSAAYRLVVANLRLVVKIAFEYQRTYSNLLDLVQEGNLGLMQAVKKFDPYREVKLSSYASWWIRAYILKFIIENWSLVKIGTTQVQRKLFFRLKKEKGRLEALGFDPGPKLLASALDVPPEAVSEMEQRLEGGDLSLNQPLEGDGAQSFLDVLPDADGLEEKVTDSQFREVISRKIARFSQTLKGKEAFILQNRLLAENPLTLQAAGAELKISRERARQIEKNVMTKLKAYLKEELPEFDDLQSNPA